MIGKQEKTASPSFSLALPFTSSLPLCDILQPILLIIASYNLLSCRTTTSNNYQSFLLLFFNSYLTSFLVNSPTLSSCSNSGIRSSMRRWTISAMLTPKLLNCPVRTSLQQNCTRYLSVTCGSNTSNRVSYYTHVRHLGGSYDWLSFPVPSTFKVRQETRSGTQLSSAYRRNVLAQKIRVVRKSCNYIRYIFT